VPISADASPDIFPSRWLGSPTSARATALTPEQFERGRALVATEMAEYSADLLSDHLDRVYVLGGLFALGSSIAGTNSRRCLYLQFYQLDPAWSASDLKQAFHHELSSVLLREHRDQFPLAEWEACNGRGHRYEAVETETAWQDARQINQAMAAVGFVNNYCQTNLENDFNTVAARLFLREPEFKAAVERYPRLRQKVDLAIGFYHTLDPRYTPAYFGLP
jgi:hypothetical protein